MGSTVLALLEAEPGKNGDAVQILCQEILQAEENMGTEDMACIQELPTCVLQAFQEVVKAAQLVMGFLEHAPGRWGISYRVNCAILSQDTESLDPEDVPSNKVLAWSRALHRLESAGSFLCHGGTQ